MFLKCLVNGASGKAVTSVLVDIGTIFTFDAVTSVFLDIRTVFTFEAVAFFHSTTWPYIFECLLS